MVPCSPAKPLVAPGQRYPGKGTFDVLDALLLEDMSMRVPVGGSGIPSSGKGGASTATGFNAWETDIGGRGIIVVSRGGSQVRDWPQNLQE